MKSLNFWILPLFISSGSAWGADLCSEKVAELQKAGKRNVVCTPSSQVDFGVKTLSADYHNPQTEPVSAPVGLIKRDKTGEKYFENSLKRDFGIKNTYWLTEKFKPQFTYTDPTTPAKNAAEAQAREDQKKQTLADAYGMPTSQLFLSAFATAYPNDHDITKYITEDLAKRLTPDPSKNPWNGRCLQWSAWNVSDEPLDVKFRDIMSGMDRGTLCDDSWPITAGALKEFWTTLTLEPKEDTASQQNDYSKKNLDHLYSDKDHPGATAKEVEDANLALVKLQDFGTGSDFKPESIVQMAKEANEKNPRERLIFDMNPGKAVWNQPIESVVEVTYEDPDPATDQTYLTTADLQDGGTNPGVLEQFIRIENDLKRKAMNDDDSNELGICPLMVMVHAPCNFPEKASIAEQVNMLKQAQSAAITQGLLQKQPGKPIVHHQVFIKYGTEGDYGDSQNVPSKTRVLNYVKVGDRTGAWSSPSRKLSDACADGNFGDRDNVRDSLYAPVKDECVTACQAKPASLPAACGADREIFTGSLPPKNIKFLRKRDPNKALSQDDQGKLAAQQKLINMIQEHCQNYDSSAHFIDHLKSALAVNEIDAATLAALKKEYDDGAKRFLSPDFIHDFIAGLQPDEQSRYTKGLDQLKAAFPKQ